MKSFRNFELREGKLSSLAKNSAVVRTVKKYANRGSDKMMLALLSVPAVSDFLSDPANIRRADTIATQLKTAILGEQYLEERSNVAKGWINLKTKKVISTRKMRPYHVEFILKKPRDFGLNKKQILNYFERKFALMDSPDPKNDADQEYQHILSGRVDVDRNVEVMAMKKGWYRIVGGAYGEIVGLNKLNDKQLGVVLSLMESNGLIGAGVGVYTKEIILQVYEPSDRPDVDAFTRYYGEIKGSDIQNLIKGKPRGSKRTEIGRTMAMFRESLQEQKKIRVFDFDDTLVRTDGKVRVTNSGKTREMSPAQYAVYNPKRGDTFDFDDFEKVLNPKPVKLFQNILRKVIGKGSRAEILTARGTYGPIVTYLKSQGIRNVRVNAIGTGKPEAKADYIEKLIKNGYDYIEFFDDSPKNVEAVRKLQPKYPEVKIISRQV